MSFVYFRYKRKMAIGFHISAQLSLTRRHWDGTQAAINPVSVLTPTYYVFSLATFNDADATVRKYPSVPRSRECGPAGSDMNLLKVISAESGWTLVKIEEVLTLTFCKVAQSSLARTCSLCTSSAVEIQFFLCSRLLIRTAPLKRIKRKLQPRCWACDHFLLVAWSRGIESCCKCGAASSERFHSWARRRHRWFLRKNRQAVQC